MEPVVATTLGMASSSVQFSHEPELTGDFAELPKKGIIRFTSYGSTEKE
jgi:hypothetical protein